MSRKKKGRRLSSLRGSACANYWRARRFLRKRWTPRISAARMQRFFSKGPTEMVRVRPAVYDDLPRLIEIAGHSVTAAQWKRDDYLRLFAQEPEQARTALVIEQDGGVMGFIVG